MSQLERRALLGAAGIGAVAAMAGASKGGGGPLNPPAGAVTGTGRTLDEVYNRIPATGAADGRTPIPGGTSQVTIAQPGSYILTGSLTTSGTTIFINNPGGPVTLDLNGFRVASTGTSLSTINVINGAQVVIRNGHISGGGSGLTVSNSPGAVVEDLTVVGARSRGIDFPGNTSVGSVVRRCAVIDTGLTTVAADTMSVFAIAVSALHGCRIEDCHVSRMVHNGTSPGTLTGIAMNTGGYICGCVVGNTSIVPLSVGITPIGASVYRNNKVHNFATSYSGGTDGGGNF